ncbi:MAG: AMP-binding protein [Sandaracinaceae bacterium]|nr:AMP-binding protein [Sandaracinaceae bacterium]
MSGPLFSRLAAPDDRPALRFGRDVLTYRQLARACRAYLAGLGASPGERVAVWTHPCAMTPVVLAAHAAAGIVSVPLDPKLGDAARAHVLADAAPARVIDPRALEPALDPSGALPLAEVGEAPLLVLYTSGTTGPPKGAVISGKNVAFDLDALAAAWEWSALDTVVHALPLFHVHGLVLGLYGALRAGGALHWLERFEPARLARALGEDASTLLFSVPTMVHRLATEAEEDVEIARALGAARLWISGSAGLPVREHRRVEAATGRGILERYGLTETLIDCAVRATDGPRPGSVGRPLDGVALRLVDDERRPLDARDDVTIGEVAIRGDNVFCGYLGRPGATAEVLDADGWFYTGDLATRAADGAIRIVGRRSTDLIKTGGYKVGAGEVEAALLEDPAVAEVAVVGAPDDDLGERIVAFVVARGEVAAEALVERVASSLTPHKRPREVRFVDALPKNAMGKVQKRRLLAP